MFEKLPSKRFLSHCERYHERKGRAYFPIKILIPFDENPICTAWWTSNVLEMDMTSNKILRFIINESLPGNKFLFTHLSDNFCIFIEWNVFLVGQKLKIVNFIRIYLGDWSHVKFFLRIMFFGYIFSWPA